MQAPPAARAFVEADAHVDIAIGIHAQRADDIKVRIPVLRKTAFLELRLAHAAAMPAWSPQALIGRRVPFGKPVPDADDSEPPTLPD